MTGTAHDGPPGASGSPGSGPPAGEAGLTGPERPGVTDAGEPDTPGDPACWLHRVCPECGGVADGDPPAVCPRCQAEIPAV